MRQVAPVLLLGFALTAGAADIWKWTDANGVVHYSDNPVPGAEKMSISIAPASPGPEASVEVLPDVAPREPRPQAFSYARCNVASPAHDETLHGVQAVTISLDVEPVLQPGHRIEVQVNGARLTAWPANALSHTLPEVFRGSHTVQVRVLDANGAVQCTGQPITFHLRQQSVLAPGRAAPLPTPQPPGN